VGGENPRAVDQGMVVRLAIFVAHIAPIAPCVVDGGSKRLSKVFVLKPHGMTGTGHAFLFYELSFLFNK
jgi:hypothetical protein